MKQILIIITVLAISIGVYYVANEKKPTVQPFLTDKDTTEPAQEKIPQSNKFKDQLTDEKTKDENLNLSNSENTKEEKSVLNKENVTEKATEKKVAANIPVESKNEKSSKDKNYKVIQDDNRPSKEDRIHGDTSILKPTKGSKKDREEVMPKKEKEVASVGNPIARTSKKKFDDGQDTPEDPSVFDAVDKVMKQIEIEKRKKD